MADNYSAAHGLTAGNSANKIAERKTPPAGILPIPKHDWLTRKEATYSAMLSAISSRLGCQIGKDAHKGRFSCSRTPRDSSAPNPGGSEENGIGICESSSQGCNSQLIRLARRNHKPGGADLAGSVHVVRSLSG